MNHTLGYVTVVATTLTLFITQQYLENLSNLEDRLPFFHPDLYVDIFNVNLIFRYIVGTKISGLHILFTYLFLKSSNCYFYILIIVV